MGVFVICAYRPKAGKERLLRRILKDHLPILRKEGLATSRRSYLMRAKDGTFIEVFEWKSASAINRAHKNRAVLAMWEDFDRVCTYETLASLEESRHPFADFTPVD